MNGFPDKKAFNLLIETAIESIQNNAQIFLADKTGLLADFLDLVVANQFATLLWELRRAFDNDCLAALTVLAQNAFRSLSVANTCALATSEPKLTDFTGRASIRTKAFAAFASSQ